MNAEMLKHLRYRNRGGHNRGLCDHDVRLNFNVSGLYAFPAIPGVGKRLGEGWQISTIYTAISGRPALNSGVHESS